MTIIEDLAAKARVSVPEGLVVDEWVAEYNRIFATSIIKECVRHFNEDYQRDFDTLWRQDLSKSIQEHFGVEHD